MGKRDLLLVLTVVTRKELLVLLILDSDSKLRMVTRTYMNLEP